MAEKQTLPHAIAFTLTYADVDGEPPLGARVFRYEDVKKLWKRIRAAGNKKWPDNFQLKYVIVGEKGTKFGRCHYHGVMFSNQPIHELGKITWRDKLLTKIQQMWSRKGARKRINWKLWPHGFVEFQTPDREGMRYALKYALKGRMNALAARGQRREGKTEYLASSYLWCSKKPPIGIDWLTERLNQMWAHNMVPASLRMRVPGGGDWYIAGEIQRRMCLWLHERMKEAVAATGKPPVRWRQLLASVSKEIHLEDTGEVVNIKAKEWLENGEEEGIDEDAALKWAFWDMVAHHEAISAKQDRKAKHGQVWKCLGIKPCLACQARCSEDAKASYEIEYAFELEEFLGPRRSLNRVTGKPLPFSPDADDFDQCWRLKGQFARACRAKQDAWRQQAAREIAGAAEPTKGVQTSSR